MYKIELGGKEMKRVLSLLLGMVMIAALMTGCSGNDSKDTEVTKTSSNESVSNQDSDATSGRTFAIVVRSAGNPYAEKEASGFREVIEEAGGTCIIKYPESATVEGQITMINELVAQNVDAIAIASNDYDALQPALEAAMKAGIKVSSVDSNVNADSRMTFVNQAGVDEIGQTLMDAVYDIAGGEGQWAILSATSQAANQNSWIESMKSIMTEDKYLNLELAEIAYGDDEYQKSVDETQALLQKYPDLKVICAPTTVGIMAAAKVVKDQGLAGTVKVTGLGLPSEMADYIGDGDESPTPYMFLWNPIDVGRLSAYTSIALVNGDITGAAGETFIAGDMGEYEIIESDDGGTEVIVGPPYKFDSSNIDEWKDVY